jgi:Tfp pilus assembly protein PilO
MINKSAGFKVLILPLAAAFVVMISVLYIKPAYDQMQFFKKSQTEKQQQLDTLRKQNQGLAELKNKWDSTGEDRALVEMALPSESDMENYIAELNGRASRSGVLLSSITSDEKSSALEAYTCGSPSKLSVSAAGSTGGEALGNTPQPDGSPASAPQFCANSVSVKLAVSGNWDQMVNFFKYLEDTNRIANITSVAISASAQSKPGEEAPGDLLSAAVDLSVYYKKKSEASSPSVADSLSSGKGIREDVIKELKEIVFTPYVAPTVSESGERNIFK